MRERVTPSPTLKGDHLKSTATQKIDNVPALDTTKFPPRVEQRFSGSLNATKNSNK